MKRKILLSIILMASLTFGTVSPVFADVEYSAGESAAVEDIGKDESEEGSDKNQSSLSAEEYATLTESISSDEENEADIPNTADSETSVDNQDTVEGSFDSIPESVTAEPETEEDQTHAADGEALYGSGSPVTQEEFDSRLSSLRSTFPNYSTWMDWYDNGHQCWGFARLIADSVFGGDCNSQWEPVYSINGVKAGDILQYGNTSGSGHTVFVTSVSGDTITFVDCNGNGNYSNGLMVRSCGVKWDNTISKTASMFGKYSFAYRLDSPGIIPNDLIIWGNPVDLGDDFYANIENQETGYLVTNEDGNLVGSASNGTDGQIWHFMKNADGSYRIFSQKDGGVIDIFGVADENDANAYVYGEYVGGANQQFYIYERYGAYNLRPKHSETKALDMTLSGNYNVSIWAATNSFWSPQSFNINKIVYWGNPVDLGNDFYANIKNQETGYLVTNEDGNLVGRVANGTDSQIWHFMKNDDGSYRIFSQKDGGVIDIFGVADENDANAYVYGEYVGGANQQFYIYERYGAYNLRPKHSETKALDMTLSGNYNVSIWAATSSFWSPQSFDINKIVYWGDPVDLGNDFYATIENQETGYLVTNEDGNLVGRVANGTDSQIWHFMKNDDGSYRIFSQKDGGVIDIFGVADENDANAYVYGEYVGGANQQFYIYERYGAYNLRPKHSNTKALDMTLNGNFNMTIWEAIPDNWHSPQSFNINKLELPGTNNLEIVSLSDDFYGKTGIKASFHIETKGSGNISYQWQYRTAGSTSWKTPAQASAKTADYVFSLRPSYDNIEVRCIVSDESGTELISDTRKANVFAYTSQPSDATASEGQVVNFEVAAIGRGVTYQWYYMRPNGTWRKTTIAGSKTAILPITAGTKNDGTSYRCVITDEEGNQITSAAGILTLDVSLRITGISEDAYDVNGESVTFHIDAVGKGDLTYQWQYKLAKESRWRTPAQTSAKTADYVFKLRPSYDNIEVRCIVQDASGNSIASDVRKANVFAITGQPKDAELALGEKTTFAVKAVGKELTYQWYYLRPEGNWNKVTVAGYNTAALVITANNKNGGTQFQCRITDGLGNMLVSAAATLTQS